MGEGERKRARERVRKRVVGRERGVEGKRETAVGSEWDRERVGGERERFYGDALFVIPVSWMKTQPLQLLMG